MWIEIKEKQLLLFDELRRLAGWGGREGGREEDTNETIQIVCVCMYVVTMHMISLEYHQNIL